LLIYATTFLKKIIKEIYKVLIKWVL